MVGDMVLFSKEGRIGHVTFNRPEKLNAVNGQVRKELNEALDMAVADEDVRVIILKGNGRAFSAGGDLGGGGAGHEDVAGDQRALRESVVDYLKIWDLPKPVIAQVHGFCFGVATQITIFCDITMVAEDARIGWPVLPLGGGYIAPMWAWLVGPKLAKEGSFTPGKTFSGAEAAAMGWANHAVPADKLEEETMKMAQDIAKVPSEILRIKKQAVNQTMDAQGFRTAVGFGAEFDAILHYSAPVQKLRALVREHTWKGALDIFNSEGI